MTLNRNALVEETLNGGQIPSNTFTNPLNYGAPQPGAPESAPRAVPEEARGMG